MQPFFTQIADTGHLAGSKLHLYRQKQNAANKTTGK